MAYTKLFHEILDSTIWQEELEVKIVWITMLAMTDEFGKVAASVPGLAKRAGVSVPECEKALKKFQQPDRWSRSQEFEGRRIKVVEGGWELLNHGRYRSMMNAEDRREYQRAKQAEYRRRRKSPGQMGALHGARAAVNDGLEEAERNLDAGTQDSKKVPSPRQLIEEAAAAAGVAMIPEIAGAMAVAREQQKYSRKMANEPAQFDGAETVDGDRLEEG